MKLRPLQPLGSLEEVLNPPESEISERIGQIKVKRKDKILLRRPRCVKLRGAGLVLILLMGSDAPDIALRRPMRCFSRLKYTFTHASVPPVAVWGDEARAWWAWKGCVLRGEAWVCGGGAQKRFKFGIL